MPTQRELPTAAIAAPLAGLPSAPKRERPWAAKARELEEEEGMWADYAAWEMWIEGKLTDFYPEGSCWHPEQLWEDWGMGDRAALYCLMCDLCS